MFGQHKKKTLLLIRWWSLKIQTSYFYFQAERRLFVSHLDHEYANIEGNENFTRLAAQLAYGDNFAPIRENKVSNFFYSHWSLSNEMTHVHGRDKNNRQISEFMFISLTRQLKSHLKGRWLNLIFFLDHCRNDLNKIIIGSCSHFSRVSLCFNASWLCPV